MVSRKSYPPYVVAASDWVRNAIALGDDVDENTTDDELEQLAADWSLQAEEENAIIVGDLIFWLRDLREWIRTRHNGR